LSRFLFATIGSLGDVHPMIAIGLELQKRGHEIVFATSAFYHKRLANLGFIPQTLRPDRMRPDDTETLGRLLDLKEGTGRLFREFIFSDITDTYEDLSIFAQGADAIIVGELVYAGQIVADKKKIPWAFLALSPGGFFSAYDMPVSPGNEHFESLHKFSPQFNKLLIETYKLLSSGWTKNYHNLRREVGLPRQGNPIFHDKYSPYLVLAAFSSVLAKKQRDWPESAVITGFAYHDSVPDLFDANDGGLSNRQKLEAFLAAGEPPVVFTLGSAAMFVPGDFYEQSLEAARILNTRAVFLMGQNSLFTNLPDSMIAFDYIPYQEIFPHASVIVHPGGIGTSAQALRAGRPTLVVPYSNDQPDNARRLKNLGTSLTLPRKEYKAVKVAEALKRLFRDESIKSQASKIKVVMQDDSGAIKAADELERMVARNKAG
jgi:UDP:flavonoid glycosyltransferase YjiC (YdhE family)